MGTGAPNLNQLWADLLVEELLRAGVAHFVLSPGSRCTPLTLAVARNPRATHTMHFDERGAAFFALGHAKAGGKPVALICTSGSATANYWPAVVEAEASRIPLILLTADRPPELLQCGANQAIDQQGLYGKYTRWAHTLPCPTAAIPPEYVLTTADQAALVAVKTPAGPVHLNCMFREPLAPEACGDIPPGYADGLARWEKSGAPYTTWYDKYEVFTHPDTYGEILRLVMNAGNGVCIIGQVAQSEENHKAIMEMAASVQWPVLVDAAAGLFPESAENIFQGYDTFFCSDAFSAQFKPDFVLHIGGAISSKRLNTHLAQLRPAYLHAADTPLRQDPAHIVTHRLQCGVQDICQLAENKTHPSAMLPLCQKADTAFRAAFQEWREATSAITEIYVANETAKHDLFAANSMPIRDVDMYPAQTDTMRRLYASRGASGIDGNNAIVAGIAKQRKKPMAALLGDLATLHDLNSLALLRGLESPLALVVVNNDGGGIFSFLPVAGHTEHFEECFGTPHGLGFEHAAALFGLRHVSATTPDAFTDALEAALAQPGATLVEVKTDRHENLIAHRGLQTRIAQSVDKALA